MSLKNSERSTTDIEEDVKKDMRLLIKKTSRLTKEHRHLLDNCDQGFEAMATFIRKSRREYYALWACVAVEALYIIAKL